MIKSIKELSYGILHDGILSGRRFFLLDRDATFPDPQSEPRSVCHSKCGLVLQMKEPGNISHFETHLKKCKSNKTAGMPTLKSLFEKQSTGKTAPTKKVSSPTAQLTCHGLMEINHPEIPKYLQHSPARGGGALTLDAIATQLFKKSFSKLSLDRQKKVRSSQQAQLQWYNEAEFGRIFSSTCMKISGASSYLRGPCSECLALLNDKNFRQALSKPIPQPENVKFMPKYWIDIKAVEFWGDIHGIQPLIEAYDKVWLPMQFYFVIDACFKY
jgi:hypothetical protein